jgi:hypothetical protein
MQTAAAERCKHQQVALCANIAQTLRKRVCATFTHIGWQTPMLHKRCANVVQTLRKRCANVAQTLRKHNDLSVNTAQKCANTAQTLRKH